jgi:outer membrane protein assembly factor BamB
VKKKGFLVCKKVEGKEEIINIDIKNDDIEKYEVVRGGITYFDNTIIFVDAYGQIKSINISNSKINWETQIDFPILSAPLIYRDQVFFISADNRIFSAEMKKTWSLYISGADSIGKSICVSQFILELLMLIDFI